MLKQLLKLLIKAYIRLPNTGSELDYLGTGESLPPPLPERPQGAASCASRASQRGSATWSVKGGPLCGAPSGTPSSYAAKGWRDTSIRQAGRTAPARHIPAF